MLVGRGLQAPPPNPRTANRGRRTSVSTLVLPLSCRVQVLAAAVGFSVLGSIGGLATASVFLLLGDGIRVRLVPWLISYAVGTLLGVALLALLPEALRSLPPTVALGTLLGGVLSFFLLEKLVLWRHCHTGHDCEVHTSSAASLVIIGDAFHTFVDGALIAAAVLTSIPLGATTALAVAAHEIPREVGDFAILLRAGYSRSRAFTLNLLSAIGGRCRGVRVERNVQIRAVRQNRIASGDIGPDPIAPAPSPRPICTLPSFVPTTTWD